MTSMNVVVYVKLKAEWWKRKRQWQDLNLRIRRIIDFKSIALDHSATLSLHLSVVWVYMSASCVSRQDEASIVRECSSDGRALALHARGRGIDTPHFHCIVCFFLSYPEREALLSTHHHQGESVKWKNGRNRRESGEAVALTSYWSRIWWVKESCGGVNLIRSVWTN